MRGLRAAALACTLLAGLAPAARADTLVDNVRGETIGPEDGSPPVPTGWRNGAHHELLEPFASGGLSCPDRFYSAPRK